MALKPITLRLDEEEYEKLKENLEAFGDPDINVAFVVRAHIRDLNRSLPLLIKAGWDLKNYFGLFGAWLKQCSSMTDFEMMSRMMAQPWQFWNAAGPASQGTARSESQADRSADDPPGGRGKRKSS